MPAVCVVLFDRRETVVLLTGGRGRYDVDLLPGTPVDLDIDFLVKSDTEPVTFVVSTWGRSKVVFQKEIDLTDRVKE